MVNDRKMLISTNHFLNELRLKRNYLLMETDKFMIVDYPITPENLEKMKIYRQELRDYFQNNNVEFPNFPERPF